MHPPGYILTFTAAPRGQLPGRREKLIFTGKKPNIGKKRKSRKKKKAGVLLSGNTTYNKPEDGPDKHNCSETNLLSGA